MLKMIYKFESKDPNDDTYLELGSYGDMQFGGITNIDFHEIDNLIKALQAIKDEISGEQSDTFKIVTKN